MQIPNDIDIQPTSPSYESLDAIRVKKEMLRKDIKLDEERMKLLWKDAFQRPATPMATQSGLGSWMKTGSGIIDGVLLGWKIYKKISGFSLFRK